MYPWQQQIKSLGAELEEVKRLAVQFEEELSEESQGMDLELMDTQVRRQKIRFLSWSAILTHCHVCIDLIGHLNARVLLDILVGHLREICTENGQWPPAIFGSAFYRLLTVSLCVCVCV